MTLARSIVEIVGDIRDVLDLEPLPATLVIPKQGPTRPGGGGAGGGKGKAGAAGGNRTGSKQEGGGGGGAGGGFR